MFFIALFHLPFAGNRQHAVVNLQFDGIARDFRNFDFELIFFVIFHNIHSRYPFIANYRFPRLARWGQEERWIIVENIVKVTERVPFFRDAYKPPFGAGGININDRLLWL